VWFASGKRAASGSILAALPGDLAGPGCSPSATLSRVGASMFSLDVDPRCSGHGRERGTRWVAIFRMMSGAAPELGLELHAGAAAEGETIAVSLDGRDRDADGRGDLTVTVTLTGAPHPLPGGASAAATLAFFDRPAGLSRDPSEPETSLRGVAASLAADARKRTTASHVRAAAGAAARLYALLCDDARKPIVTTSAGPVRCGDVRLVEEAAVAETEAALNLGDPFAAMSALARVEPRRKDLDGLLAKSIPSVAGKLVRTTAATPDVQPPPAFGPVAILPGGDILVRTRDRVIKVDHVSFEEARVDAALLWPSQLASPTNPPAWTLASVEERCDAPTLLARFGASAAEPIQVPFPILAGPRCTEAARVPLDLLGTTQQGALLAIRGELVVVPAEAPPRPVLTDAFVAAPSASVELGAARSPNGRVVAVSTVRGVLVATVEGAGRAAKAKLWTTPAVDSASACVPNDTADRIACVVQKAVAIYDAK
jgi:hypothetical protein